MMISKNTSLVIAAAIAGTAGISYQLLSENHANSDNRTNSVDKHWWNKEVSPEYALSEIQIAEINNIRAWNNEKVISIQEKLVKLRTAFEGLDTDTKANMKELRSYKVKIWNLEDKILDINKETETEIRKILNSEQLAFFNSSGYGWWSIVDSSWTSYEDKRLYGNQKMRMSDRGFSW